MEYVGIRCALSKATGDAGRHHARVMGVLVIVKPPPLHVPLDIYLDHPPRVRTLDLRFHTLTTSWDLVLGAITTKQTERPDHNTPAPSQSFDLL